MRRFLPISRPADPVHLIARSLELRPEVASYVKLATYNQDINSMWPSKAIRRLRTEWTLAQVMACCLTAPSHYLNQCWLIISKVLWYSSEGIIMRRSEDTNQQKKFENYILRISLRSPRGQWVNSPHSKHHKPADSIHGHHLMPQSHHTPGPRTGCFEQKSYVHSRGPHGPRAAPYEFCLPVRGP